jgi:hypothetical protein
VVPQGRKHKLKEERRKSNLVSDSLLFINLLVLKDHYELIIPPALVIAKAGSTNSRRRIGACHVSDVNHRF